MTNCPTKNYYLEKKGEDFANLVKIVGYENALKICWLCVKKNEQITNLELFAPTIKSMIGEKQTVQIIKFSKKWKLPKCKNLQLFLEKIKIVETYKKTDKKLNKKEKIEQIAKFSNRSFSSVEKIIAQFESNKKELL